MAIQQQKAKPTDNSTINIGLNDLIYVCYRKWFWFVFSLVLCLGVALFYILRTTPVYSRTASLLIKEQSNGKSIGSDYQSFSDLGLLQSNSNVINEMMVVESPDVMRDVVKRLRLDISLYRDGLFHDDIAYGPNQPVMVQMPDFGLEKTATFRLKLKPGKKVVLSDFELETGETPTQGGNEYVGQVGHVIKTPVGAVTILPTENYDVNAEDEFIVRKNALTNTTNAFSANLFINLQDDRGSVVSMAMNDVSPKRAEDVLNEVIKVYNEDWVKDKNQIAEATSNFINERLNVIERELGNVDEDISSFKSEHLIPDVQQASTMAMQQSTQANVQLLDLNNQLSMTKYLRNYMTSPDNIGRVLPVNTGINNPYIEKQISAYNELQLDRNAVGANNSTNNPLIQNTDDQLNAMRQAIVASIDNQIQLLNTQISNLRRSDQKTTAQIAANPSQAKYLLSVERQQKVKEALYLFLLQKREENEVSQTFTSYNTRVIMAPQGSNKPIKPLRKAIFLVAFFVGLLAPLFIIYLMEVNRTTIRNRKELESLSMPFLGEIPMAAKLKGLSESERVVVKEGKRDVVNEAFRVLRTNLGYVVGSDTTSNVVLLTSYNPGSGKTFLSVNLAVSLAIKGKKVLLVDGDLRRGSASAYIGSPARGLSDFLVNQVSDIRDVICKSRLHNNLDVLPTGPIPPNPTELLEDGRFNASITELRNEYDFIIIDCPPLDIVADTQIIAEVADRTIFVVRAGLFRRDLLPQLEDLYVEKKCKNMAVVLNGTTLEGDRYGKYGYGYGYGEYYSHNSNYDSHYGEDSETK